MQRVKNTTTAVGGVVCNSQQTTAKLDRLLGWQLRMLYRDHQHRVCKWATTQPCQRASHDVYRGRVTHHGLPFFLNVHKVCSAAARTCAVCRSATTHLCAQLMLRMPTLHMTLSPPPQPSSWATHWRCTHMVGGWVDGSEIQPDH
jgi:hypothetical protein